MAWKNGQSRTSSAAHRKWRRDVLRRDRFRCQIRGPGCTRVATEADHVVNVAQGGALYALGNGQAVCAECHEGKTQVEAAIGRERFSRYRRPRRHPSEG